MQFCDFPFERGTKINIRCPGLTAPTWQSLADPPNELLLHKDERSRYHSDSETFIVPLLPIQNSRILLFTVMKGNLLQTDVTFGDGDLPPFSQGSPQRTIVAVADNNVSTSVVNK